MAWAAGALLLDTVQPMTFDAALGRFVPAPGISRTRGEGWASSLVGEHGIRGLPDGKIPPGPKVVFRGDSFVEGLQVDDAERMAQVFTRLAGQAELPFTGLGLGTGGDSLIDSHFKQQGDAPALGPAALTVFFLGKLTDVLPDVPHDCRATFSSAPWRLEAAACPPSDLALGFAPLVRRLELAAGFAVWTRARDLTLRLAPGTAVVPAAMAPAQPDAAFLDQGWDFLLARLKERGGPLLLVYAPAIPRLEGGNVRYDDPSGRLAERFALACQRNGVPFLDLGPAFAVNYAATGRFPRGFRNSPPGQGHLNRDGHRLAAQAVLRYVKEQGDALLAR